MTIGRPGRAFLVIFILALCADMYGLAAACMMLFLVLGGVGLYRLLS